MLKKILIISMSLYLYSYWTYANYVCEENIVSDSYEVINNYNYNELLNIFSIQWLQDWKRIEKIAGLREATGEHDDE